MEDISYLNFFKFISSQKLRIPLIETAVIQLEQIESIITTDEQGFIKKKVPMKTQNVQSYLQKLLEKHETKNKIHIEKNSKVCYFYKKGCRSIINDTKLKEILSKHHPVINIDLVQPYIKNLSEKDKFIRLKLNFIQNQYKADFDYSGSKVTNPIIIEQSLDIATILIHSIENSTYRRVLQIEIEFIQEFSGYFYLVNVPKCITVEPKYTFKYPILREEDILTLSKSIPKNFGVSKTPKAVKIPLSPTNIYTFRRGQLRNVDSNLESPIRMTPMVAEEPKKEPLIEGALSIDDLNYRSETPPGLKNDDSTDQGLIREILKGFFTVKREIMYLDKRNSLKKIDSKRITNIKKANMMNFGKNFAKLLRRKEYDTDFIECVLKTYFKKKNGIPASPEFGISSQVTTEEFTNFLSTIDLELKREPEENISQQPLTPENNRTGKNMQFVKESIEKKENKLKPSECRNNSKRIIDHYLSSVKSKSRKVYKPL